MPSESWVFRVEVQEGESLGHLLGHFRRANHLSHKIIAEHLGVRVEWLLDDIDRVEDVSGWRVG